jgi:hypothetical protein
MNAPLDNAKALYLEAIRDGDAAAAIERYSGSRYTQHSTPVKDGKDGFVEFFDDFHRRNPVRDVERSSTTPSPVTARSTARPIRPICTGPNRTSGWCAVSSTTCSSVAGARS